MKILKDDYKKIIEDVKKSLNSVMKNYWDVAELDVEVDDVTYFYNVKQSRLYLDEDIIVNELNLELDAVEKMYLEDAYYDLLKEEFVVDLLDKEIEAEIKVFLNNLLSKELPEISFLVENEKNAMIKIINEYEDASSYAGFYAAEACNKIKDVNNYLKFLIENGAVFDIKKAKKDATQRIKRKQLNAKK